MSDWSGPKAPDDIHLERTSGAARRKAKKVRKARAEAAAATAARAPRARPRGPQPGERRAVEGGDDRPPDARRVAVEALVRIEEGGAFANLALGPVLERSGLDTRDRGLVTELVYGTTRMRRACDWLVDRFVTGTRPLDPRTRSALRLGAYQLVVLGQPPHAAVTTAVSAAPKRSRGLVNAVLRKVAAEHEEHGTVFPDQATALSYPDWIVERLTADLGPERALGALEAMNEAASATVRDDGYTQDEASQWVAELVEAGPGDRVLDLCAAPGGKATALAATGAHVVAADVRPGRVGLIAGNARRTGTDDRVHPLVADGRTVPFAPGTFDRVLVDAPCSGLGVLHRRADARWRMVPESVDRLARLQVELVRTAAELVRPGGLLVVSVCTLTARETTGVDCVVADVRPDLEPLPPPGDPWVPWGRGALLLPQAAGTDGMALHRYRLPG
ncbi:MAG TPA: transcription antitermination factor NusB [Iamia sp.]